ncbi:MAG: DNA repair protein RecN [Pseudomonadota bacterium]
MLIALSVRDIVLIKNLTLSLEEGLTALTGETGAGKSILLDALGLALGARADKGLVRAGEAQGAASATFSIAPAHAVWDLLVENGLTADRDEGHMILRRVQRADGRALAFINDEPVSVGLLRRAGALLVETHGQNEGQGFLQPAAHRALLDAYAGAGAELAAVREAFEVLERAEADLEAHRAAVSDGAQEAAYLGALVEELERLAPDEGEEAALAGRRALLMASEKIVGDLRDAAAGLAGDTGVEDRLAAAARRLEAAVGKLGDGGDSAPAQKIAAAGAALEKALIEAAEARSAVDAALAAVDLDPEELEAAEERLFALRAAARKYNTPADRLPALQARAAAQLAAVEEGTARTEALEAACAAARTAYAGAAADLSKVRAGAAKKLDAAVKRELSPLKLDKARFRTSVAPDAAPAGPLGTDKVAFEISTNPGAPFGALSQIASGGELSRFVLALKAALAAKDDKTVIIFDEVDSGVGGAVADAVGERLAKLAKGGQVLVVTHSPQVAARAHAHWRISKTRGKTAVTRLEALDAPGREEEIARMLSGARVTDEARAAARNLLDGEAPKKLRRSA